MLDNMFDLVEMFKRLVKYLVEGIIVGLAASLVPKNPLKLEEIVLIALTASAVFAILDAFVPAVGVSARTGAGFGIGANLVRFPFM